MLVEKLKQARHHIPPCDPPWWAKSGHLQTILGHLLSSPRLDEKGIEVKIRLESEEELIHATYLKGETNKVLYLFHGLGGSAEAAYMQRTAIVARHLGFHVFLSNHRGCGAGAKLAKGPYHSGRAEDLSSVIAYGRSILNEHQHVAVGFSLSANALLLLAAGIRGEAGPDMAIAINGPVNLDRGSRYLSKGLNLIYNYRFMRDLKRYVLLNHPLEFHRIKRVFGLRTFDEVYTAPVAGFKDRADYYQTCSAKQYLSEIRIPTVLLTASDDPFVGVEDYLEAKLSPQVVLHIEKHGGHMGYLCSRIKNYRWLDHALKSYLQVF